jgi:ABC-type branched-subunit amino acid transport system substrate-binding protein
MAPKKSVALFAAALVLVAACSSSKKSNGAATTAAPATTSGPTTSSASPTTSANGGVTPPPNTPLPAISGNTTTGVTATEIKVGALIYKAFYADVVNGFNARLKTVNDAGGVYGRKIVVDTVADDNQTADTDLSAAKTLVQQDGVFAVAPVMTAAFGGANYLNTAKVPFFGWSIEPRWCGLNWGFGFQGNDCDPATQKLAANWTVAAAKLFPDGNVQGKTVAITAEDNDSARAAISSFAKIWESAGAKVVLQDTTIPSPPAVVGDFTPFAQKIMTANNGNPPDYVEMVNSVSDTIGLYKKLAQLGYKGVAQGFTNYDPRLLGQTKGLVTQIGFAPYEDAGTIPAVQQMITDLKAYQPDIVLSQPAAAGYWIADFLIDALKKAGPNLSREALYNAINGGYTYDNKGGTTPVEWPLAHTFLASIGIAYVQDQGTQFAVPVPLAPVPLMENPGYTGK